MTTALQTALRSGAMTLIDIQTKLFIKVMSHSKYENLKMFKYNMIDSPMANPIVQECRGIILDMDNNWECVARPFDKFFNYGEGHAKPLDWSTAKVQEKLDGSLMILYYYMGAWHVATSGTPDARGKVHDHPTYTFETLFWNVWDELGYELPHEFQDITFMFELMTPYNRVVVPHEKNKLVLIGVRNRLTGKEWNPYYSDAAIGYKWNVVKQFPLTTIEDIVTSFDKFDGINQEGYVVVDSNFNRVKVKHPGYVAIHHLKGDDGPSYKKMFGIVCAGESSEVLTYFPEWQSIYDKVKVDFEATLAQIESDYQRIQNHMLTTFPSSVVVSPQLAQKEYASLAVKTKCPDALFRMRAGKITNFREYFSGIQVDHAMKIIGYKE